MKAAALTGSIGLSLLLFCCMLPQTVQPLRLYDLNSGSIITVELHQTSRNHGTITSYSGEDAGYAGEYVLYDRPSEFRPPASRREPVFTPESRDTSNLPDLYGYGRNTDVRPVGSGVIVGRDSIVIEIVFYRISADLQAGDGVARDNRGRVYRIYLSPEELPGE